MRCRHIDYISGGGFEYDSQCDKKAETGNIFCTEHKPDIKPLKVKDRVNGVTITKKYIKIRNQILEDTSLCIVPCNKCLRPVLYGYACKFCGDTSHLGKRCPSERNCDSANWEIK